MTASLLGTTTLLSTTISADEIFNLFHSVDPAYREMAGVAFMMHDNVLLLLSKLKGDDGQYLWQPGLTLTEPDRLLGKPVVINQNMSSTITSGDKTILFGDFGKFWIRDVASIRMRRLIERRALEDQESFVAFSRHDSALKDAGTGPLRHLLQV